MTAGQPLKDHQTIVFPLVQNSPQGVKIWARGTDDSVDVFVPVYPYNTKDPQGRGPEIMPFSAIRGIQACGAKDFKILFLNGRVVDLENFDPKIDYVQYNESRTRIDNLFTYVPRASDLCRTR